MVVDLALLPEPRQVARARRIAAEGRALYVRRMPLVSRLFRGDKKLEAVLTSDPAHITPGSTGEHVSKIHTALLIADGASVASHELATQSYGPSTAKAVLRFKQKRNIVNHAYQKSADNIVGKMTIAALDHAVANRERFGVVPNDIRLTPGFT